MLARQLLLERSRLPIARALERVAGLQTQYAPSGYIGLWTRLDGFERRRLTRALEARSVVQGTLLRSTIHLVSARDYRPFAAGIRRGRRAWWLQATRRHVAAGAIEPAAQRVRTLLAEGPRRRDELVALLGVDATTWNGVGLWVDLVRVPPSGTWERRRADLYATAEDWLSPSDSTEEAGEREGFELLVRRYLGGFGPASQKDIANWAGLPAKVLEPTISTLKLRRFRDERGGELLDLPRAPLPDTDTPAPVRFLPTWDATLLVHARRTQILPEPFRPLVFNTKTPHSAPTFLVDGQVAGTWREERGRVAVEPFEPLARGIRREVEAEAERLAAFLA